MPSSRGYPVQSNAIVVISSIAQVTKQHLVIILSLLTRHTTLTVTALPLVQFHVRKHFQWQIQTARVQESHTFPAANHFARGGVSITRLAVWILRRWRWWGLGTITIFFIHFHFSVDGRRWSRCRWGRRVTRLTLWWAPSTPSSILHWSSCLFLDRGGSGGTLPGRGLFLG
uniref:Uncharacterized protein n=1 Tax=Cacopsylla melanoneura TaxID=428564 RepID=A0A8D8Q0I1_9HEMI